MALVEEERAVEGGAAAPVDELLQPRLALLLLRARADERGVRGEEHALLQPFRHPEAERAAVELLRAVVHRDVAAEIAQVALRVVPQVAARAEPQVLRAAARQVVEDDRRELAPLADAGAVADEEAGARRRRARRRRRQQRAVALARERDALDLQRRDLALGEHLGRQPVGDRVVDARRRRRRQRGGLGDVGRVRLAAGKFLGWRIGGEDFGRRDADGVALELLPPRVLGRRVSGLRRCGRRWWLLWLRLAEGVHDRRAVASLELGSARRAGRNLGH